MRLSTFSNMNISETSTVVHTPQLTFHGLEVNIQAALCLHLIIDFFLASRLCLLVESEVLSRPIAIKFYLKHHWGGGKASVGFDPDRIRTLVSMATDSSHRVIMGKTASSRFLECFCSDPFHTCR